MDTFGCFLQRNVHLTAQITSERKKTSMAWFLVQFQFNGSSAKAMVDKPQDRLEPAKALAEMFGGKIHHYFFSFGHYDGLAIAEVPDNISAAAFSMKAASTNAFSRFELTVLIPSNEAEAAMRMARDQGTAYRPPNA